MEVASPSKRQAVEASFGSPKSSSPSRTAALSRDSSVKGLDKGKVKPAHPISFVNHSSFDSPRVQAPKGMANIFMEMDYRFYASENF